MFGRKLANVLTVAVIAASTVSPAVSADYKWQIQSVVPETDADWYVTLKRMKEVVEGATDGAVEMEIFPVGALVDPDLGCRIRGEWCY